MKDSKISVSMIDVGWIISKGNWNISKGNWIISKGNWNLTFLRTVK